MSRTKKICCILLALIMVLATAGCGSEAVKKKKRKKIVVVKKVQTTESVEADAYDSEYDDSETDNDIDIDDDHVRRDLAEKTSSDSTDEVFQPDFQTKVEKWNGPGGYVIVYPSGNEQLQISADRLKKYFEQKTGKSLKVVDDKTAVTNNEILIGNTNRGKSKLSEKEFAVSLTGSKVFFESGNFNGSVRAVNCFISLDYTVGSINTLTATYDFESVKKREDGLYQYVWGDDFDGNAIDDTKWDLTTHMGLYGYSNMMLSKDPEIVCVADGRLKLSARHWLDPDNPAIQFAVCYTVEAKKHMNFQYGYLEMRARYPVKTGGWPSIWLSGNCTTAVAAKYFDNGDIYPTDFSAESDILEYSTLTPNLHKWFIDKEKYGTEHVQYNFSADEKNGGYRKSTSCELTTEDSYIYHIFGYEWTPDTMKIYCDGTLFMTFYMNDNFGGVGDMTDFKNPMYIRFNNHVQPDKVPTDYSSLPSDYYIDYVRVYQKPGVGGIWIEE